MRGSGGGSVGVGWWGRWEGGEVWWGVLEKEERGRGWGGEGGGGVPNSVHAVGDEKAGAAVHASFSMRGEALLWSHPHCNAAAGKLG